MTFASSKTIVRDLTPPSAAFIMTFPDKRILTAVALAFIITLTTSRAYSADTPADIVELPKFEVTADRILPPLEKWRYVSIPGYEIISNASERTTANFVRDFFLLQQAARIVMNTQENVETGLPTYIVVTTRGSAFKALLPTDVQQAEGRERSLFFSDNERAAIIADLTRGPEPLTLELEEEDLAVTSFNSFHQNYFKHLLSKSLPEGTPRWGREGLSRLLSGIKFSEERIELASLEGGNFGFNRPRLPTSRGIPLTGNGGYTGNDIRAPSANDAYFAPGDAQNNLTSGETTVIEHTDSENPETVTTVVVRSNAFINLGEFFAVDENETWKKFSARTYSNQAYLFIHFCLYGHKKATYQPAFFKLLEHAATGPVTEEFFKECFGEGFSAFATRMRVYNENGAYRGVQITSKDGRVLDKVPPFTVRTATDAESGRIAGEVLRLGGHPESALNRLIAPYVRGDRSPDLLAALGIAEQESQNTARARKFLEAAVSAKTTRARAYTELGKLRFAEVLAKATSEKRLLNSTETAYALAPLETGLAHPPDMPEIHLAKARVWLKSETRPDAAQFRSLIEGAYKHPKDLTLVYNVAATGLVHAYGNECRHLIDYGIKYSPQGRARDAFVKLAGQLPDPAPTPSAAKQPVKDGA